MAYRWGPNDLLRNARLARRSPSGSGRPMSRQELAEAATAWLFEHGRRDTTVYASIIGKWERGEHRWPFPHVREALRAVLGKATDAELGFFLIQGHANDPDVNTDAPDAEPSGPTLLRVLLAERHWQVYRTFQGFFRRAARDLATREDDPTLTRLDVSERQFNRWIHGARPRPDACRVLESMFGHPIARLIGSAEADTVAPVDSVATGPAVAVLGDAGGDAGGAPVAEAVPVAEVVPDAAVQVSVSAGGAVTVHCQDGVPGRVAVLTGGVRVLIDAAGGVPASLASAAVDAPVVAGGARVYSLAERRAR